MKIDQVLARLRKALGDYDSTHRGWVNFRCPWCPRHKRDRKLGLNTVTLRVSCFRCSYRSSLRELLVALSLPSVGLPKPGTIPGGSGSQSPREARGEPPRACVHADQFRPLPDPDALVGLEEYALSRGVDPDVWPVGWFPWAPGRLVLPFYEGGRMVYWQSRLFSGPGLRVQSPEPGDAQPRAETVWGIDMMGPGVEVVITEGPFDAIAATDHSVRHVGTCLLGNSPSPDQIRKVREAGVRRVTVCLDSDARQQAAKLAIGLADHFVCRLVEWPEGEEGDPSEAGQERVTQMVRQATDVDRGTGIAALIRATPISFSGSACRRDRTSAKSWRRRRRT